MRSVTQQQSTSPSLTWTVFRRDGSDSHFKYVSNGQPVSDEFSRIKLINLSEQHCDVLF